MGQLVTRAWVTGIVLAICLSQPELSYAGVREVHQAYIGGSGDVTAVNCDGGVAVPAVGGVCFSIEAGDRSVSFEITDSAVDFVAGRYGFPIVGQPTFSLHQFCGSGTDIPIPAGAMDFYVLVDEAYAVGKCTSVPATFGTATAKFAGA